MLYYIVFGILGLLSGFVFYCLAIHHVKVRSEYDNGEKLNMIKNKRFALVWMLSITALFFVVALMHMEYWQTIRILVFTLLAFNVSAVDVLLRRIPNSLLLSMIVLQVANIGVQISQGNDPVDTVMSSVISLFLGYIIFTLPGLFKMSVGAGDVKYSTVIGFMIGFYNYVQAMVVMSIAVLLFYIYLKISKKGNIKTAAPMAPFLSVGTFVALLFPMF